MAKDIKQDAWWQSFYEDTPFELYLARTNAAEMEETIAFLRDKLHLEGGATIFDQCCGLGGMTIPLAKLGYRMIGADLCAKYITMAKAESEAAKVEADFHVADAFEFVPAAACDGAFNWYTSFGYAEVDSQNLKMVARAFESLKPGCWFALDFLNMPMIMASFKEKMSSVLKSEAGDIVQTRHCTHDLVRGTMDQSWTWTMPDGKVLTQKSTLRAYLPVDLLRLFAEAGFTESALYGGTDGSPVSIESGRCIVVGRKPLQVKGAIETIASQSACDPVANAAVRQGLYAGKIYHIPASVASKQLVAAVVALLQQEFACSDGAGVVEVDPLTDIRKLQFTLSSQEMFERVGKVRKLLYGDPALRALVFTVLTEQGFAVEANAVDPARLRAVSSGGHENPLAAPAYTAHRDCWYANPQAQINWWIPLHDVGVGETFAFFPALFDKPVVNDSTQFDYDKWAAEVGFQNTSGVKAIYPAAGDFDRASELPFSCKAGDIMLFAASHLHQTAKNTSGATRFSVDFRTVNLNDHDKGLGAPNVDNLCTGSALSEYLRS